MIRTSQLIKKEEIFNWFDKPDVLKIQIKKIDNKNLKDKSIYKIYVFYNIESGSQQTNFLSFLGSIKSESLRLKNTLNTEDKNFLDSLISCKAQGFIKLSSVKKVYNLNKKYKLSINFPKKVKKYL